MKINYLFGCLTLALVISSIDTYDQHIRGRRRHLKPAPIVTEEDDNDYEPPRRRKTANYAADSKETSDDSTNPLDQPISIMQDGKNVYFELEEFEERLKALRKDCKNKYVEHSKLKAEKGDIIEFRREYYSHYGVYIGYKTIIHMTRHDDDKSHHYVVEKVAEVAQDSLVRVNNLEKGAKKRKLKASDRETIMQRVFDKLNTKADYDLLDNNCETFAAYGRYGKGFSEQSSATEGVPIIKVAATLYGGMLID